MSLYLAMDVGGTSIKYGVIDDEGNLSNQGKIVTPDSLDKMYVEMEKIYHDLNQEVEGLAKFKAPSSGVFPTFK